MAEPVIEDMVGEPARIDACWKAPETKETIETSSPAYTWLFLAMVEMRLRDEEAAKAWYRRADSHIAQQRKQSQAGKLNVLWNRLATLMLLQNEARQVLGEVLENDTAI